MKKVAVLSVAVLIVFFGTVMPSAAWTHGIGWWGPGVFFGGIALGAALAHPYYGYPYYAGPYAYSYPYGYPYPGPTFYEEAPLRSAPLVQRDVCYGTGCYHLYGDGVIQPWQWVWTPAAPVPVPPSR